MWYSKIDQWTGRQIDKVDCYKPYWGKHSRITANKFNGDCINDIIHLHPWSFSLSIACEVTRTHPKNPAPSLLWTFLWFHTLIVMESVLPTKLKNKWFCIITIKLHYLPTLTPQSKQCRHIDRLWKPNHLSLKECVRYEQLLQLQLFFFTLWDANKQYIQTFSSKLITFI